MKDFDAIVIGAGNGGLSAAVALQRGGMQTLLLERHNIPGGCATSFVRGDYEFEVALHQLSGLGTEKQPAVLRHVFDSLGVTDKVTFIEEHHLYRYAVPGVIDITLPASVSGIVQTLSTEFPEEADAIQKFMDLCEVITLETYMALPNARRSGDPDVLKRNCRNFVKYGLKSTQDVMDEFFISPVLKAVLGGYWGYAGQPLDRLPFSDLGVMLYAYAAMKPWHIEGGSQALSNALLESFLEAGGDVRFNCGAEKILTEGGGVSAVRTEHGDVFTCNQVVSNASSVLTYNQLLDRPELAKNAREDFKSRRMGVSGFVLYMGLDCTPEDLGLEAATNFIATTIDDKQQYARSKGFEDPLGCLFTCYTVGDKTMAPQGKSVAALMCLQYGEPWDSIAPEEYAATKFAYAEKLIALAENVIPNFRQHIEEIEIGTPVTMMRYLNTPGGAIYGFDQTIAEHGAVRDRVRPVDGLHLAGSWTGMGGFQPTYQAGAAVAASILRKQNTKGNAA
ncbi:phytoene desaturase family protein [Phaeobacter marinintestinus]|uniref:phytoene desaturase family protein n=1 Tax=Falsiphaeobacter marinintestinus TaxID=1492905 RepID=UPI0011B6794D|nr:NAD(P)/FAD-dependent oxidoreductase [Phaeobacter marinintestinus]